MKLKIALIQTTTGRRPKSSMKNISKMIGDAAKNGANFAFLPETCNFMEPDRKYQFRLAEYEESDESLKMLRQLALKYQIWLLVGSLVIQANKKFLANRSFIINNEGGIVARYDKIHLFDANLGSSHLYRESDIYRPGNQLVIAETPWGKIGLTICYDLRFPQLYQSLANAGANVLTVPSAFTVPTGTAHWDVLLRARSIETGCFVIAPAQTGTHEGGRQTYGHSLVVNPLGQVIADGGTKTGVTIASIDPSLTNAVL